MRVPFPVGERVVLSVHGHPFLPALPGGEPQEHSEDDVGNRVYDERPVSETTMQIDRGRDHGHLGQGEGDEHNETHLGH